MLSVEYIRSLNCNYERMLLEKKPEEKKYQYCILSRGGIRGLLSCGLRYINGNAYLYYDISSKQNVEQLYCKRSLERQWLIDFLWNMKQIQQELERFLLDMRNVIWSPNQVFLDLETREYSFLYIPYYEGEATFGQMMNFFLEHLDYDDEGLVECVYHMNEQWEQFGEEYLRCKIFEDAKALETVAPVVTEKMNAYSVEEEVGDIPLESEGEEQQKGGIWSVSGKNRKANGTIRPEEGEGKRGLRSILEGRKQRNKRYRDEYHYSMKQAMEGYAVAEETTYEAVRPEEKEDCEDDDYGRTIYIEEKELEGPKVFRLYAMDGSLLASLDKTDLSIGKKKDEVDLALEDSSVSRLHARIITEQDMAYLEDLNSTNGTFKNGHRLHPYEKRKLDKGDEIKCGKVSMIFRY